MDVLLMFNIIENVTHINCVKKKFYKMMSYI